MTTPLKPVKNHISGQAAALATRVNINKRVKKYIKNTLDADSLANIEHTIVDNETLIIYVSSASQASISRFHSAHILATISEHYPTISKLKFKHSQHAKRTIESDKSSRSIESNAAIHQLIESTAQNINDPALKLSLQKLAAQFQSPNN